MARELKLLTIPEILRMATGSVDFPGMRGGIDWSEMFAGKVAHGHFDALVDEIQANGFGMPIVLCDRYNDGNYVIGNGHHRLCAAILLGLWRIPVMVSEGGDRTDFMCNRDSADDYARPIQGRSDDYWSMLQSNLPYGFITADPIDVDALGKLHSTTDDTDGGVFYCFDCATGYRVSDYCCLECHDAAEHVARCGECANVESQCACGQCSECGYMACICTVLDLALWLGDRWAYFRCTDCGEYGYPREHGKCARERDHDGAIDEHYGWQAERANLIRVGALYPDGAWHPENVLSEAYAEHAAWEADAPLRLARDRYLACLNRLREAVLAGAGDYAVMIDAENVADAWKAYAAL